MEARSCWTIEEEEEEEDAFIDLEGEEVGEEVEEEEEVEGREGEVESSLMSERKSGFASPSSSEMAFNLPGRICDRGEEGEGEGEEEEGEGCGGLYLFERR